MSAACCAYSNDTDNLGLSAVSEATSGEVRKAYSRAMQFLLDLEGMLDRSRQRRAMRDLDGHMLRDIGLSASDVEREASKPFWRS